MSSAARQAVLRQYDPPQCGDGPCGEPFMDFVYFVVVPCAVLTLLVVLLSWLICCKACTCKKDKTEQPLSETELETYNTIRRASASLRHMSHNRDTPLMGSRAGSSLTLERGVQRRSHPRGRPDSCCSAPGTLQRHHRQRHVDSMVHRETTPTILPDDGPRTGRAGRTRYSDQPATSTPPPYTARTAGDPGLSLHRYSADPNQPSAPPPPPYSAAVSGDALISTELLMSADKENRSSVQYHQPTVAAATPR